MLITSLSYFSALIDEVSETSVVGGALLSDGADPLFFTNVSARSRTRIDSAQYTLPTRLPRASRPGYRLVCKKCGLSHLKTNVMNALGLGDMVRLVDLTGARVQVLKTVCGTTRTGLRIPLPPPRYPADWHEVRQSRDLWLGFVAPDSKHAAGPVSRARMHAPFLSRIANDFHANLAETLVGVGLRVISDRVGVS